MFKSVILLWVAFCVVIEARPKWQFLPAVPGYVPVYIQSGDTPLEQINPELAEAFHALPAGRSASKQIEASPEEMADQPREDIPVPEDQPKDDVSVSEDQPKEDVSVSNEQSREEVTVFEDQLKEDVSVSEDQPGEDAPASTVDHRPYAKKLLEKKKKVSSEVAKPIERR